jgi:hypothetical protein
MTKFNLRGRNKTRKRTRKQNRKQNRKPSRKSTKSKSNPIKKEKYNAGELPLRKFSIVKLYKNKERTSTTKWLEGVVTSVNNSTNKYAVLHSNGTVKTNVPRENLVLIKEQTPLDIIKIRVADNNVIKKFKKAGLFKDDPTNKLGRARFFALANKEDDMTESLQRIVFPGRFH